MSSEALNPLEREVLRLLLAGCHPVLKALRAQLEGCHVRRRELTGCGFFTEFSLCETVAPAPVSVPRLRIGDVEAEIEGVSEGAGFVLFVTDGYLDTLEGYSFGESWPVGDPRYRLSYLGGSRDLDGLELGS